MGLHEKGAMKYRQAPGLWRGISLVEGPDGRVQGIRFGEVGLDLETEAAYRRTGGRKGGMRLEGGKVCRKFRQIYGIF